MKKYLKFRLSKLFTICGLVYVFIFMYGSSLNPFTRRPEPTTVHVTTSTSTTTTTVDPSLIDDTAVNTKPPRIFCIVLTKEKNWNTKAKAVYDTWVSQCDNSKFISTIPHLNESVTNSSTYLNDDKTELKYQNLFDVLHPKELVVDTYLGLTTKVFAAFKHVYNNYGDYDWYLKADDDAVFFINNLRQFLANKNSSLPITYGYNFVAEAYKGYHSGGAGYLLSKESLTRLGKRLNENFTSCSNSNIEDIDVARCLRLVQVYPKKSIDELGRERFHLMNLKDHFEGKFPKFLYSYAELSPRKVLYLISYI